MCASNKLLAYSLSLLMLLQPLLLRAQTSEDMRSISLEAYEYGRELVDGTSMPTIDESGTISLPATGDTAAGDRSLSIDDLSPSSGSHYTVDELREVSNDNTGMLEMGSHVRTQLSDDAHSDNPSSAGAAYQLMSDQSRRLVPDMSNDPSLLLTREILTDIAVNEEFADCEAQTQFIPGTTVTHLPDLKHCNRVVDRSGSCTVYHDYTAEVIHHHDGPYNMLPLDEDSFHVWIGNLDEDNRWRSPVCTIFEAETQIAVVRPEAITAVILERVQWDDRVQLWVGKTGEEQLVFTGPGAFPAAYAGEIYPHGLLPPETPGPCELNTSWSRSPNLDITEAFLAGVEAGDIVSLFSRVSVFDGGELFARLRIDYDPAIAIEDGLWSPPDCINAANAYYDGFASGSISCTLMPTETAEGSGCTAINGITVCDSDLAPSPFAEINPLCERVEVTTEYDFYKGDYTYINENGTEITITGGDGDLDSCRDYEEDTTCAFVSQTCVEGAEANGNCYVYEETWDCGYGVEVPEVTAETTYDCPGPISCMGMDCINPTPESSDSFAETAALLNAVQYMAQDTNCVPVDGTEDVLCDIFGGDDNNEEDDDQHYECKVAVGGSQDCCDVPTNVGIGDYLAAMASIAVLDSSLMAVKQPNAYVSGYRALRSSVGKGVSKVTQPFTNAIDGISGAVDKVIKPIKTTIDTVTGHVKEAIKDALTDMFDAVGQGINGAGGGAGAGQLTDQAIKDEAKEQSAQLAEGVMQDMASAANTVMTALAIYAVTMLAIQMIYECEDEEFELASKRDLKACTYIGSYCRTNSHLGCIEKRRTFCCFNSPLSRILNPQIKAQLDLDTGTVRAPNCDGFSMEQITAVDWSLIDLSEWTALLSDNGLYPDETMDIESLTGTGSALQRVNEVAGEDDRLNAADRTFERLEGLDIDGINREAYENTVIDTGAP